MSNNQPHGAETIISTNDRGEETIMSTNDLRAELLGGWEFLDARHKLLLVAAMYRLFVDQKKAAADD